MAMVTRAQKRAQTVMGEGFEKSIEYEESPKFIGLLEFLHNATLKAKVPTTYLGPNTSNELAKKPLLEEEENMICGQNRHMGQWHV